MEYRLVKVAALVLAKGMAGRSAGSFEGHSLFVFVAELAAGGSPGFEKGLLILATKTNNTSPQNTATAIINFIRRLNSSGQPRMPVACDRINLRRHPKHSRQAIQKASEITKPR